MAYIHTYIQTDRQTDRQTGRQTHDLIMYIKQRAHRIPCCDQWNPICFHSKHVMMLWPCLYKGTANTTQHNKVIKLWDQAH